MKKRNEKRAAQRRARERRRLKRAHWSQWRERQYNQPVAFAENGARACPDCGVSSMHCDRCGQEHPFPFNFECVLCTERHHVFRAGPDFGIFECFHCHLLYFVHDATGKPTDFFTLPLRCGDLDALGTRLCPQTISEAPMFENITGPSIARCRSNESTRESKLANDCSGRFSGVPRVQRRLF